MVLTSKDVGKIFSLNTNGNLIMVDDISDTYVYLRNEMGEHFTLSERKLDGTLVTDPQRTNIFRENMLLGSALAEAESSALRKILVGTKHDPEVLEATSVLETIHQQQDVLRLKIQAYRKDKELTSREQLDEKIQNANNNIGARQDHQISPIPHER